MPPRALALVSIAIAGAFAAPVSAEIPASGETMDQTVTVLYRDDAVTVERTLADPTDLWVTAEDLPRVNGFVLKPEGACLDDLCVPVRQDRDSDIFLRRNSERFVSVTELADRLGQQYVADREARVWSFGEIPAVRRAFLEQGLAPDFTLPDRAGNPVSLADFRGKKVLLITWASW